MLQRLYEYDNGQVAAPELRSVFVDLMFDVIMRMIAGKRYFGRDPTVVVEESRLFKALMREALELHGESCLGDYFPVFRRVDVQGVGRRMVDFMKKLDEFLQDLVDERRAELTRLSGELRRKKTLIDVMLARQETEPELHSDQIIKGLILVINQILFCDNM